MPRVLKMKRFRTGYAVLAVCLAIGALVCKLLLELPVKVVGIASELKPVYLNDDKSVSLKMQVEYKNGEEIARGRAVAYLRVVRHAESALGIGQSLNNGPVIIFYGTPVLLHSIKTEWVPAEIAPAGIDESFVRRVVDVKDAVIREAIRSGSAKYAAWDLKSCGYQYGRFYLWFGCIAAGVVLLRWRSIVEMKKFQRSGGCARCGYMPGGAIAVCPERGNAVSCSGAGEK